MKRIIILFISVFMHVCINGNQSAGIRQIEKEKIWWQGDIPLFCESEAIKDDIFLQGDTTKKETKWFLASIISDQGRLWSSPFRVKKKDLALWIPVLTATSVSIVFDEQIYSSFKNFQDRHAWVSDLSPVITYGGDNRFVLGTGAIFTLAGLVTGNKKTEQTGLIALQTFVNAGLIVQVGKLLTGRQRPSFENGEDRWYGFPASLKRFKGEPVSKFDAFPSGHTIEAWALATVFAEQYKDTRIVPVISYTLATGVGLSRVTEDAHWLSDVILGAAMGYGIGKFMVREHKNTNWTFCYLPGSENSRFVAFYKF